MENPKQASGLNRLEAPVEALACADAENREGPPGVGRACEWKLWGAYSVVLRLPLIPAAPPRPFPTDLTCFLPPPLPLPFSSSTFVLLTSNSSSSWSKLVCPSAGNWKPAL